MLFLYICELFKWYDRKFHIGNEQEIFDFLKKLSLADLPNLGFPVSDAMFQKRAPDGMNLEEEVRYIIRTSLDAGKYNHLVRSVLDAGK